MSNIVVRGITGVLFVAAILLPLFFDATTAKVVFGIFMTLGLVEFYQLFQKNDAISPATYGWTAVGALIFALFIIAGKVSIPIPALQIAAALVFGTFITEVWRKQKNPLLNVAIFTLGIIYLVVPFVVLSEVTIITHKSFPIVAGMFILIWTNDTFAYITGKAIGRTKLIERISPKKTWEGTIGGIVFTIVAGALIGWYTDKLFFWIVAGVIVAPSAILGDLLESSFKRNLNIKDSGKILPGHGGILDRFDATLLTVPFFVTNTFDGLRSRCKIKFWWA